MMILNEHLRRFILRRAKFICHNRFCWERARYVDKCISLIPELPWLYMKRMYTITLCSAHGKRRLYLFVKGE